MSANNNSGSGKAFLLGVLLGGAVGAVAALLLAPRKGDELRSFLTDKSADYAEVVKSKAAKIAESVQQNVEQVRVKSEETVEKATENAESVKDIAANLANEASSHIKTITASVREAIANGFEAGNSAKNKLQAELGESPGEPGA
jgi:gas vesicle protein